VVTLNKKTWVRPHKRKVDGKKVNVKGHLRNVDSDDKQDGGILSKFFHRELELEPDEYSDEYEAERDRLKDMFKAEIRNLEKELEHISDERDDNLSDIITSIRTGEIQKSKKDEYFKEAHKMYQDDMKLINDEIERLKLLKKYRLEELKVDYMEYVEKDYGKNVAESVIPEPDEKKMNKLEDKIEKIEGGG